MKKNMMVIITVIIALLLLSVLKDVMIKVSAEKGVALVTGLKLKIQSFRVGLIRTRIGIRNLRLFNPKGFSDKIMLNMPEVYVDYNLPSIFKGKVHIKEMRIDMKEFTVVKNEKGELNLDSLEVVRAQKQGKRPGEKEGKKPPQIQIDSLHLEIGRIYYKDYSKGGAPDVKEFNLNINEKYKNIKDPYSLVSIIVVRALMNTTISSITGFDLQGLRKTVLSTLVTAQRVAQTAVRTTTAAVKKTAETAQRAAMTTTQKTQEAVRATADTLKKTTEGIIGTLKPGTETSAQKQ